MVCEFMKYFFKLTLFILSLTLLLLLPPVESAALHEESTSILLLDSYHENAPWSEEMKNGVKAGTKIIPEIRLITEHLAPAELKIDGYEQAVVDLLRIKYNRHQFKAVISSGVAARDFVLRYGAELFPDIPIIFTGIIIPIPPDKAPPGSISLIIDVNLADTLETALNIFPSTRNVYVISGTSVTDAALLAGARKAFEPYEKQLNFRYIIGQSTADLVNITADLPPNSIIYALSVTADHTGKQLLARDIMAEIMHHAKAPIFSPVGVYLGAGAMGGKAITAYAIGLKSGETLAALLGPQRARLPEVISISAKYTFDWRQMEKWNVPESRIPPNSEIINRPRSFFTVYKWQIIGISTLFFVQTLIIVLLLIFRAQRRKAEEALRKSEEKFAKAFKESPLWVVMSSFDDGLYMEVNEAFLQATGFSRDEVIGRSSLDLATWKEPQERQDIIEQIKTHGYVRNVQVQRRTKNGNILTMWFSGDIIEIQGQKCLLSVSLDMTNRIKTETELRESESRLRAILVANPDPVVVYDAQGHPIFINPAFSRVFGWTLPELEGRLIPFVPDDQKEVTGQKIKELYDNGIPVQFETRRLTREGRTLDILVSAAIVRDREGKSTGMVVNLNDITERKRIDALLRQTQKMEAIGTLAGGIAHDFNNLLSAIIGYTELVMMDIDQNTPIRQQLERVLQAAMRAKNLVSQILTYSRKTERELKPLSITPVLQEALQFLRASIPTTIEIQTDFKSRNDVVSADPTQINQMLLNLGTNAAHAMEESGGVLQVITEDTWLDHMEIPFGTSLRPGPYLKLTISDNGHGMDRETQTRIFEPYFTTKEKGEGTGLGLAVVHGIVVSLGGDIRVYSEPETGTTFHVRLPVLPSDQTDIPDQTPSIIPRGQESIMFVDDEAVLSDLGKDMLEHLGYRVTNYSSGTEALAAFKADPAAVDLVITDQTMPNMTGMELAREMIQIRPDIPIILCTGFSRQVSQEKLNEIGIKGFLYKPVEIKDIAAAIRSVLDSTGISDQS
jgi:two-component system cell cycle sensor histidine kinase/response regulator CckA